MKKIFVLFCIFFVLAGLYHCAGFFFHFPFIPGAHWRHGVFIIVNIIGAWLILWRPPWTVIPFSIVTVQSLYSHSHRMISWWTKNKQIDWISIAVLIVLPLALFCIVKDKKINSLKRTMPFEEL